jgi:hypothetical protein
MQGKIDEDGMLYLVRKDIMAEQECPFSNNNRRCGDLCVLFGEPYKKLVMIGTISKELTYINLCHKALEFEAFKDER